MTPEAITAFVEVQGMGAWMQRSGGASLR